MKLSFAILGSIFLPTTLAAPHNRGISQRIQRRTAGSHLSAPKRLSNSTSYGIDSDIKNTDYSSNWAGAVIFSPPTGQTFNAVSGTFTVPTPSIPGGASGDSFAASAWVGIDGDTYSTAILQTGIDFTVTSTGDISFDAWYEWYPDFSYDFTLDVSAGDVISLSVSASTSTTGVATIENQTTGYSASIDLSSTYELGGQNAEWIVEDFMQSGALVALADFGTVDFTECVAETVEESIGLDSATVLDLQDTAGTILTSVSILSNSEVTVLYE